jgi:Transposase DDE domain
MDKYLIRLDAPQVPPYDPAAIAAGLTVQLGQFLFPLLVELDRLLDKRLVRTFVQSIAVILTFRDRANGLLLSELGGYLLSPEHAPAGTKRLSNLLHSAKWAAALLTRFLWQRASTQLAQWQQAGEDGLVIWDESGWEKPESRHLDDLGPTRSSKAARLTHIKPGYYSPPRGPIFVPGLQWLAVLLIGRRAEQGPPLLAAQRWWTNRGPHTSYKRDEEGKLLVDLAANWGRAVIHVFDQGFASAFWLGVVLAYHLRFVLRWRKDYQLLDAAGNRRLTWKIAQGKRGWSQRTVWDARRARWVVATVLVLPVAHPDHREQPLSLVICRSQGRSPWYLLTAEAIETDEQAWQVVFVYVRRWQIELRWKYEKSELAFQSPRVYAGQAREKLLLLATLAYAFLLTLLAGRYEWLRLWLLRYYAHRTGKHCRAAKLPLTRLRCALSRLWQDLPPDFALLAALSRQIQVIPVA